MSFAFGLARLLKSKVNSSKWAESIVKNRQVILVCLGTAFLLVAGIGKLGWSIQTYDGTTPAENLNEYIFLVLSHIGTFLIFVDIFLIASSNLKTK
jgi:TRAP-type C4-dicarboxylate transport system permease small subunit